MIGRDAELTRVYDFDTLELGNLAEAPARQLIQSLTAALHLPDADACARDVGRLTKGNPGRIVAVCEQAGKGRYVFGRRTDLKLVELDRRIRELPKG